MDRRGLWLLSSLFALGCRETAEPSRRELCVAFANSVAVNNATLELATQQYASAARAMEKWEQRDVTAAPEQDPSGNNIVMQARGRGATVMRATHSVLRLCFATGSCSSSHY